MNHESQFDNKMTYDREKLIENSNYMHNPICDAFSPPDDESEKK